MRLDDTNWHNPIHIKVSKWQTTKLELVNEIFEPFEQVSQVQTQLLGTTFEMPSGGPGQTHIRTGVGSSSSNMYWGERKNDNSMTSSRRKR